MLNLASCSAVIIICIVDNKENEQKQHNMITAILEQNDWTLFFLYSAYWILEFCWAGCGPGLTMEFKY